MINKEIITAIKDGMTQACADMHSFTDQPELTFNAEYLFTVATAKAINKHNFLPAHAFKVHIEHCTRKFSRDCLPLMKTGSPIVKGSSVLRGKASPRIQRPGRIDIAVYHEPTKPTFGKIPLCAIELKGFNPKRVVVLKDLRRNLEFMRVSGKTGTSVLDFTVFAALHSVDEKNKENNKKQRRTDILIPKEEIEVAEIEKAIHGKYKGWLTELGSFNDVIYEIETFTVSWEPNGTVTEELNELVIDSSSRHLFTGVIVKFSRKREI